MKSREQRQAESAYELLFGIYARQSLTRGETESLPDQVERGRRAVAREGTAVVEFIEPPSTSGSKHRGLKRQEFPKLVEMVRSGEINAVWALTTARISRGGGPGWAPLLQAAIDMGLDLNRFVMIRDKFLDESALNRKADADREFAEQMSEYSIDNKEREARDGKPSPGGLRPFGRNKDGLTEHRTEGPMVRQMGREALGGRKPYSFAEELNRKGIKNTGGGKFTPESVRRILVSPRTAGYREIGSDLIPIIGCEPLIEREAWKRLRDMLETNKEWDTRPRHPKTFELHGFVFCALCGKGLRGRYKSNTSDEDRRYCCPSVAQGGCNKISASAAQLEREMERKVMGQLADPAFRRGLLAGQEDQPSSELEALSKEKAALQTQRLGFMDLAGVFTKDEIAAKVRPVDQAIKKIDHQMGTLLSARHQLAISVDLDNLPTWAEATFDQKRDLMRLVVNRVEVGKSKTKGRAWDASRLTWHLR
jgi:site-specific DNA recombinase